MKGYAHPAYVEALAEFGRPVPLKHSGGWLLVRPIPNTNDHDAMGPYPLFTCRDWSRLASDLASLPPHLASVSLVADPFGQHDEALLQNCFRSVTPFKTHYVTEFNDSLEHIVSDHHRYYARRALELVEVERCARPADFSARWARIYAHLVRRHSLRGMQAFSPRALGKMLQVPGAELFLAWQGDEVVAAHQWYIAGDVAYSHLAAATPRGYELMASYALHWVALEQLANQVRFANLGAGAGLNYEADDGLDQFKRGWCNASRVAYFCGSILNKQRYDALASQTGPDQTGYFPAYRHGEFV